MSVPSSTVSLLRSQWSDRFTDTGNLVRETDSGTFNPSTLQHETISSSTLYSDLGCLVRPRSRTTADFGEREVDVEGYSILVPYTSTGARPGDKFTVTASVHNPDLVGAVLVLREILEDSYLTRYEWVAERIK